MPDPASCLAQSPPSPIGRRRLRRLIHAAPGRGPSRPATGRKRSARQRADPDLSCDECFELLDAYVELELARGAAAVEMPLMRAHLRGWSACRDDYESLPAPLLDP